MSVMKWTEVIGQERVQERLMQMVDEGRLPHAIMLCGPMGSGKLALAVAFAKVLLSRSTLNPQPSTSCNTLTCTSATPPLNCRRWGLTTNQ